MKGKLLLAALLTLVAVLVAVPAVQPVFAADNGTSAIVTTSYTFDIGPLIMIAVIGTAIATVGFVVSELYSAYTTKSAQMGMMQTTATGIQSIVSMATLSIAAGQGIAVTEIAGIPTQIIAPEKPPTAPATK
jgi:hypothetical protein